MRVFLSCDIEGVATTTLWEECRPYSEPQRSAAHTRQMTDEVIAACEGAIAAGATYILIKDAHGSGTNIDISRLPKICEVNRSSCGSPFSMVYGIDESFDAAMFVGYHAAAGRDGNPLSHTETTSTVWVKLNGVKCSEFMLFSWACALCGVPSVFLSGDKMLCDDSGGLHPALKAVAVKDGFGGMTRAMNPVLVCERIRETATAALNQDLKSALCTLPDEYVFEVCFKEHRTACRMAYYPGFEKVDDNTICMKTNDLMDVLRATMFVL